MGHNRRRGAFIQGEPMNEDGLDTIEKLQGELRLCENNIRHLNDEAFLSKSLTRRDAMLRKATAAKNYRDHLQRRIARLERIGRGA